MTLRRPSPAGFLGSLLALLPVVGPAALRAEEHVVLTNGFELSCSRHEAQPDTGMIRIYPAVRMGENSTPASAYIEIAASSIRFIEAVEIPAAVAVTKMQQGGTPDSLRGLLTDAGARHHIDVDLLASLIHAESGGHSMAVSRAGAQGLMQLMPATAASLGVQDSFQPAQNIAGGTAYLDQLLSRYHDDLTLALAAYNAGPGAVDRWHGVPPYRETRTYVARIISEYNLRKKNALAAEMRQVLPAVGSGKH